MPKKNIYRQPGAQHFQLVHRSQRDPLIHDPDASQRVLKPFERENTHKGKTRKDLEETLPPEEMRVATGRASIGQATLYDIFYDDTDYDYMQHLRPISDGQGQEEGVETIIIPAPAPNLSKGETRARGAAAFLKEVASDVPLEALPSATETARDYETGAAVPSTIAGFQPNMDPHLRQVLEALEDDAFVDDDLGDGLFGELVKGGERDDDEYVDFEFDEEEQGSALNQNASAPRTDDDWMQRFARFKRENTKVSSTSEYGEDEGDSEGRDTVTGLPKMPVAGGKRRRKGGASDASGYSLTSSSMVRNKGLSTLDDQFARIEEEYTSSGEDRDDDEKPDSDDEVPQLREDFDSLLDEFLEMNEVVAGRLLSVLPGSSGTEKLDVIRRTMAGSTHSSSLDTPGMTLKEAVSSIEDTTSAENEEDDEDIPVPAIIGFGKMKDRWDVETVLSTYSNLDNHPRLIRASSDRPERKTATPDRRKHVHIQLDPRTGLPKIPATPNATQPSGYDVPKTERSAASGRPKGETFEEKKARKQAVKEQRQARRVEKKVTKETFSNERSHQIKIQESNVNGMRKF